MNSAIRLVGLRKNYDLAGESLAVLKGIDLEVPEGDYIAIMGPSGSGKSTLLNLLGCLDKPTSGEFYLGTDNVAHLDDDQLAAIRAFRIGFVFQSYNLIPQLTVVENIESPLAYQGPITEEGRARCLELAQLVGLGERLTHRPQQLSGGQQQRAGIARGLANLPRYILADEPTGNLDSVTSGEILALLEKLNATGKTIILVTHEEEVAAHARRIVRLRDGLIQSDTRLRPVEATPEAHEPEAFPTNSTGTFGALVQLGRTARLGVKNLLLHPLRSLLTVLGIFIGVASVIWLLAIGEGISAKAQEQIAEMGANNIILNTVAPPPQQGTARYVRYGVTENDYLQLAASVPGIEKITPLREQLKRTFGYGTRQLFGRLVGTTQDYQALHKLELERGRFLTPTDITNTQKVCVLTPETALMLMGYEDPIGRAIHIGADFYTVVGILKNKASAVGGKSDAPRTGSAVNQETARDVYIPITTLWTHFFDIYSHTESGVPIASQVTLSLTDSSKVLEAADVVRRTMSMNHQSEDYTITVPLELLEQARNTRLMFIAMMGLVAAISLVVGGIGIMNIMLATVTERTREIGIRRAIGARRRDITQQFLVETIVLSIGGGLTGAIGGLACSPIFALVMRVTNKVFPAAMAALPDVVRTMVPIIVPWSLPLAFGISVAIGIVFGLYPAKRAALMNPIEALRHVT
jgi:ABC-type lipoprotein export system ATPase subunit/ABC-type antimicrobial peptide transport system permease subunit